MTIRQAIQTTIASIESYYDHREANNIAVLLLESITGYSKMDQFLHQNETIADSAMIVFDDAIIQLAKGAPIQYVLGKTWFMDLVLKVNEHTLIPRPETEELVEKINQYILKSTLEDIAILDIGTGSGCIGIALAKKHPRAKVTCIDISTGALSLAAENAATNGVSICLKQLNILNTAEWKALGQFNIIVSNPPYITKKEAATMHTNVLSYEPHTALFVEDNDPLIFYKAIHRFSQSNLTKSGAIFLEINEQLGPETLSIFEKDFNAELHQDMQGKNRMISAYQF